MPDVTLPRSQLAIPPQRRVISAVDPDARHGRETEARDFDGYKGHLALDPDAELITATAFTPGNAGHGSAASTLVAPDLPGSAEHANAVPAEPLTVYGDSAYGLGSVLETLEARGAVSRCKAQPSNAPGGRFTKDEFAVDLAARTVTCPAGEIAPLRGAIRFTAEFGRACAACPLVARCTASPEGQTITVGPTEALLARGRAPQGDPTWRADYRATRPKVERKIADLM